MTWKLLLITPDRKQDYLTELVIEGLQQLNCELYASDVGNGIAKSHLENDLLTKRYDAAIAFFAKVRGNSNPKYHLLQNFVGKIPIAYVDGSEWTASGNPNTNQMNESLFNVSKRKGIPWINERMLQISTSYLKRECFESDANMGIIPLPFGLMNHHKIAVPAEKDIDLFCVFGQCNTGLRSHAMQKCNEIKQSTKYKVIVETNLPKTQYVELLSRSRIVIDAWGGGETCDRFYEALGAQACCLYQRYNVVIPKPFIDGLHAQSYDCAETFNDELIKLLENVALSNKIGKSGYDHALSYHTSIVRAKTVLSSLGLT